MLILFDLDDTLMDDGAAERAAATHLHKRVEPPLSVEEFASRWSMTLRRHFDRYLAGELSFQGQRREMANASHTPPIIGSLGELLPAITEGEKLPGHSLASARRSTAIERK